MLWRGTSGKGSNNIYYPFSYGPAPETSVTWRPRDWQYSRQKAKSFLHLPELPRVLTHTHTQNKLSLLLWSGGGGFDYPGGCDRKRSYHRYHFDRVPVHKFYRMLIAKKQKKTSKTFCNTLDHVQKAAEITLVIFKSLKVRLPSSCRYVRCY